MTRFTRESAVCRASNPPMFGPVATGCCYRLGIRTEVSGADWGAFLVLERFVVVRLGLPHVGDARFEDLVTGQRV